MMTQFLALACALLARPLLASPADASLTEALRTQQCSAQVCAFDFDKTLWEPRWHDLTRIESYRSPHTALNGVQRVPTRGFADVLLRKWPDLYTTIITSMERTAQFTAAKIWVKLLDIKEEYGRVAEQIECIEADVKNTAIGWYPIEVILWALEFPTATVVHFMSMTLQRGSDDTVEKLFKTKDYFIVDMMGACINKLLTANAILIKRVVDICAIGRHYASLLNLSSETIQSALTSGSYMLAINALTSNNFDSAIGYFLPFKFEYVYLLNTRVTDTAMTRAWIEANKSKTDFITRQVNHGEVEYTYGQTVVIQRNLAYHYILKICKDNSYFYSASVLIKLAAALFETADADALSAILMNLPLYSAARFIACMMREGIHQQDLAEAASLQHPSAAAYAAIVRRFGVLSHSDRAPEETKATAELTTQRYLAPTWSANSATKCIKDLAMYYDRFYALVYALEYSHATQASFDAIKSLISSATLNVSKSQMEHLGKLCASLYPAQHGESSCMCSVARANVQVVEKN